MHGNMITGAGYFFRGLNMLTEPGVRGFVLIPLLANIVMFLTLGGIAYSYLDGFYQDTTNSLPGWLGFLSWIIAPLFWILGGLLTGYLSTFVVLLLTSPFHSLLAEKVEERLTGRQVQALEGVVAALLEIPRALLREVSKLLYYLPRALLVLVLTLIPGLNALSPILWFLLGAWMMSLQFVDYPMDNHRLKFREVKEACASRRISSLGFGGVVAFVSGIPLVNLIVIPAAVIGATILWCEELAPKD